MSTKTTIKRIALVAVSALGLGVLTSVAPASAAAGFNATYSAPTSLNLLTGYAAGDAGTIQIDLAGGGAYGALSTSDSATVTLTANDGTTSGTTKDYLFLQKLSLATTSGVAGSSADYNTASTGYNVLNNGTVAVSGKSVSVTTTNSGYASASGKVYINVAASMDKTTYSGAKVKYTLTTSANGVIQTFASTITLTIDAKAGTATATPSTYAQTINIGGTATATLVTPYSNVPKDSSLTKAFALTDGVTGVPTFNVTAVTTGGTTTFVRDSAGTTITATNLKNALDGDMSITYTITVSAPATAVAGETIVVGDFTFTVQPYTPTYTYSTVSVAASATYGYYVSASIGGDGIIWGQASNKTNAIATVTVTQKDQYNTTISAAAYAAPVTATLTGKGSLSAINGTADVVVKSKSWTATNGLLAGTTTVDIFSDGTSGEGTLTLAVNGVSVKTYTVRFFGDAATISAVLKRPIGSTSGATNGSDGSATTYSPLDSTTTAFANPFSTAGATKAVTATTAPAIAVSVKDANGYVIPTSVAPIATIGDLTVVSTVSRLMVDSGVSDPALAKISAGTFVQHYSYTTVANTSGKTATVTFTYVNAAGTQLSATPVTVTLGGAVVKAAVAFDDTSYAPGQAVTLTFTGLDAAGNKAYDGQDLIAGGIESTLDFGGNTSVFASSSALGYFGSAAIVDGKKVRTTYAPVTHGTWTLTGYLADGSSYTASSAVANPSADALDAANEATDAANAATDAANAAAEAADAATAAAQDAQAAVSALATQVASLIAGIKAQITTLTNLVIKIQKKVRA